MEHLPPRSGASFAAIVLSFPRDFRDVPDNLDSLGTGHQAVAVCALCHGREVIEEVWRDVLLLVHGLLQKELLMLL